MVTTVQKHVDFWDEIELNCFCHMVVACVREYFQELPHFHRKQVGKCSLTNREICLYAVVDCLQCSLKAAGHWGGDKGLTLKTSAFKSLYGG